MNLLLCYRILGVMPGAEPEAVKRAYRRLTRQWHPDRFGHDPKMHRLAEENFKQINLAYTAVVGIPPSTRRRMKRAVDAALATQRRTHAAAPLPERSPPSKPSTMETLGTMARQALGQIAGACRNRWRRTLRPEPSPPIDLPGPVLPPRPRPTQNFEDIFQEATDRFHEASGEPDTPRPKTGPREKRSRSDRIPIRMDAYHRRHRGPDADRVGPVGRIRSSRGIRGIGTDDED